MPSAVLYTSRRSFVAAGLAVLRAIVGVAVTLYALLALAQLPAVATLPGVPWVGLHAPPPPPPVRFCALVSVCRVPHLAGSWALGAHYQFMTRSPGAHAEPRNGHHTPTHWAPMHHG